MRGSVGNSGKSKGTVENYCPFWFLGDALSGCINNAVNKTTFIITDI